MKRSVLILLAVALAVTGCTPKAEKLTLKEGTPAYTLAKDLAATVPALAPDKDTVLVETKDFNVYAADVIQAAVDNLGTRAQQLKSVDAGQLKQIIDRAASSFAERRILLAAAAKAKTVLPAGELDKALQAEYQQAGGEQAFLDALKTGEVSVDHVKKSVEETLLINKLLEGVAEAGAKVSEADLKKAYEQETVGDKTASVRHILILTQGKTDAEKAAAKAKIEGILAEAKAGADFAELAKKYSEDPGSKDNGGLYENFSRGQMVKPFEDAAFTVPVGQLSGVVETSFGYHIIKVIDRKKETRPFEAVKAELEARLKQTQQGKVVQDYIQGLKDKAKIKVIGL
ncbi:MAG TPA: peptidylprolyl isomerase [Candidatus Bathyarchaeia archaeon]|nr:peptidylprolyl isomerase [Candidatus Bathyarchaeia archaeon]